MLNGTGSAARSFGPLVISNLYATFGPRVVFLFVIGLDVRHLSLFLLRLSRFISFFLLLFFLLGREGVGVVSFLTLFSSFLFSWVDVCVCVCFPPTGFDADQHWGDVQAIDTPRAVPQ